MIAGLGEGNRIDQSRASRARQAGQESHWSTAVPAVQSGQSLRPKAASLHHHEAAAALRPFAHDVPRESFSERQDDVDDAGTARLFGSVISRFAGCCRPAPTTCCGLTAPARRCRRCARSPPPWSSPAGVSSRTSARPAYITTKPRLHSARSHTTSHVSPSASGRMTWMTRARRASSARS